MIISCCDSRAAPETIFSALPGDIFVVRNVANLVPPNGADAYGHATSAALEFAVLGLKVKHILVMGHACCGGVQAALAPSGEPLSPGNFVGQWIPLLEEAANTVKAMPSLSDTERQTTLERLSVRNSLDNLRSFPFVHSLEQQGLLTLYLSLIHI